MTQPASYPDFERIANALDNDDPAQAHGMLCGILSVNGMSNIELWFTQISDDDTIKAPLARETLLELFTATVSQLDDECMSFSLLLPPDEESLHVRVDALGQWCQSFLSGLGVGGVTEGHELSAEVREYLDDLSQIARVGFDLDMADQDDEAAYIEIVEYVRMGVLMIKQELGASPPPFTASSRSH